MNSCDDTLRGGGGGDKSVNVGRIKGNQYDMAWGLLKIGGVGFYKKSFIL
jgi:hypothetical protein